jgi:CarD family transcriptional regulator
MSIGKSTKAATKPAAAKTDTKKPAAPAKKPPAKPLQAKPAEPAKSKAAVPAKAAESMQARQAEPSKTKPEVQAAKPAASPPQPEPETVEPLTSAPKPKADAKPIPKPKTAAKAEPQAPAEPPKPAPKPVAKAPPAPEPAEAAPAPAAPAPASHSGVPSGPMRPMTPPRAMAKAEIFVDGDFVVYPTHGVGKVERIATEEIAGHTLELIHITFDENRMTLRVPTNKARTAGLRKLASPKQFSEVLATLKGRARIKRTMWSRRAQEYEAKINSGDPQAIAEVVRDLHRNAGQPDQSFSERQIYESALDRLAAEYAALEHVDKATAIERLIAHLKSE